MVEGSSRFDAVSKSLGYLLLRYLDLAARLDLQMPDGLTSFAYDEADTFVRDGYDNSIRTRRPIRSQQEVLDLMTIQVSRQLLCILKLL